MRCSGLLRWIPTLLALLTLAMLSVPARAQAKCPGNFAFEVASIRPSAPGSSNSDFNMDPGVVQTKNVPLEVLLQFAFSIPAHSKNLIAGAPNWLGTSRYDITAKEDETVAKRLEEMAPDQKNACLHRMLAALLQERFALRTHTETRPANVFALEVGKGGPKLQPAQARSTSPDTPAEDRWSGLHNDGNGNAEGKGATMAMITDFVGSQPESADRIVVNKTNLTGTYDFTLKWTPSREALTGSDAAASGPSFVTALQEQMGLRLRPATESVEVLVIDHVEKPSQN